jgi:predicted DNA-binding transcriptional regulator YafY
MTLLERRNVRYTDGVAKDQVVQIVFTDSRGQRSARRIMPDRIWFGCTDWIREPQWLLDAYDLDRGTLRSYAMRSIENFTPDTALGVPH